MTGELRPVLDGFGDLDGYTGALGGLKRRDFLKFCTGVAATLGLSPSLGMRIAEAATAAGRPPVIWLSAQECTGCTESLLRAHHPTVESLILDMISLDYHETLCAGCGHQAEAFKAQSIKQNWGKYVLVVDGSIPTRDGGVYCMVGGRPILDVVKETAEGRGDHRHRLLRVMGRHSVERPEPDAGEAGARDSPRQDGDQHPRLPAERLQLPVHRSLSRHLRQGAGSRRQEPAEVRLRPADPRELRAPAALRRRPLRAGVRGSGAPRRMVPLQARL